MGLSSKLTRLHGMIYHDNQLNENSMFEWKKRECSDDTTKDDV